MALSAKRFFAVRPDQAVHEALHDRVTAIDRGRAATDTDRVQDRVDQLLQLPGQSHSEGSRGIAEISERGSGILGRGPQCDEVGRDLKGVALVAGVARLTRRAGRLGLDGSGRPAGAWSACGYLLVGVAQASGEI